MFLPAPLVRCVPGVMFPRTTAPCPRRWEKKNSGTRARTRRGRTYIPHFGTGHISPCKSTGLYLGARVGPHVLVLERPPSTERHIQKGHVYDADHLLGPFEGVYMLPSRTPATRMVSPPNGQSRGGLCVAVDVVAAFAVADAEARRRPRAVASAVAGNVAVGRGRGRGRPH